MAIYLQFKHNSKNHPEVYRSIQTIHRSIVDHHSNNFRHKGNNINNHRNRDNTLLAMVHHNPA